MAEAHTVYFVRAPLIHYIIITILLLHFVERWDVHSGTNKVNEAVVGGCVAMVSSSKCLGFSFVQIGCIIT